MSVEALKTAEHADIPVSGRKNSIDPIRSREMEPIFGNRFTGVRKKGFGLTAEKLLDLRK
jgi:hypothetical protein